MAGAARSRVEPRTKPHADITELLWRQAQQQKAPGHGQSSTYRIGQLEVCRRSKNQPEIATDQLT